MYLQNSHKRSLYLGESSFAFGLIERKIFIKKNKDPIVEAYKKFIKDIAILLGADEDAAENDMEEVFKFEIKLAQLTLTRYVSLLNSFHPYVTHYLS